MPLSTAFTHAALAAVFGASVEVACVIAVFPTAASDLVALAGLFVATLGLFGVVASLAAVLVAAVDRFVPRRIWPTEWTLLLALAGALSVAGVLHLLEERMSASDYDFPRLVSLLSSVASFGVVFLAIVLVNFFVGSSPPRVAFRLFTLALVAAGVALQCFEHFVLASLHLRGSAAAATALSLFLYVLALVVSFPSPSDPSRRFVPWLVPLSVALGLFVTPRNRPATFLLHAHAPGASAFARAERALFDFDGDGASPTFLGGTDCAPFDAKRGPTRREIPGDGVDQDCRGGDARVASEPAENHRVTPPGCAALAPLSILLVTIDALRADAANASLMPNFTTLANIATRFDRAYAPATMTNGSMTALFTGRPYADLVGGDPLDDPDPVHVAPFTVDLAAHDVATAGFNVLDLDPDLQKGFRFWNPIPLDFTFEHGKTPLMSAALVTAVTAFLDHLPDPQFFAWVHLPDVHAPYRVDEGNYPGTAPYARDVAYTDVHLGRLLAFMQARGLARRTAIVVTADHGEELRARGREGHGPNLFEEVARVPLVVAVPGCPPSVAPGPVSLTELASTLRGLAGLPVTSRTLFDDAPRRLPVVVEEDPHGEGSYKLAIYDGTDKLMVDPENGGRLLFDLAHDPLELWNRWSERPEVAARIDAAYQRWLDAPGRR